MRKQPIEFRSAEVTQIMQCWRTGESCSVIGIGSVGKSNLIQHLIDPAVIAHYLNDLSPSLLKPIIIDPNMLGPLSRDQNNDQVRAWAGYELMMHRLFMSFYPFELLSAEEARHFYDTYQALQDGSNPLYAYMGLRYFELGLQIFLRQGAQIVFLFDEFEELMRQMSVKFFQTLRGLRDQYKGQLSYVTFARTSVDAIAQQFNMPLQEFEPFKELFNDNELYIGPYNHEDSRRMIAELSVNHSISYSDEVIEFLQFATGGFSGLLRAAFHSVQVDVDHGVLVSDRESCLRQMALKPPVRKECQTIWNSISLDEQAILNAVVRKSSYSVSLTTEQAVITLLRKQLLQLISSGRSLRVYPPILAQYVEGL